MLNNITNQINQATINFFKEVDGKKIPKVALYNIKNVSTDDVQKIIQSGEHDERVIIMDKSSFDHIFQDYGNHSSLSYYDPTPGTTNSHIVKIKYQYEDAYCEIVSCILSNIPGAAILEHYTDDDFLNAIVNHEGNKKYARFFDEDKNKENGDVEEFIFHHPNGNITKFNSEEGFDLNRYMIGIEIIEYKPE